MTCELTTEALYAWVDGEAGARTERITLHQARCPTCRSKLQDLHAVQGDLSRLLPASPRLDPLIALQHIRQHPAARKKPALAGPGRDSWDFAWGVHRGRCLLGLCTGGAVVLALVWMALTL